VKLRKRDILGHVLRFNLFFTYVYRVFGVFFQRDLRLVIYNH